MPSPDAPRFDLELGDAALPYAVELPVLGVAVRFECSHLLALQEVEVAYGWWRPLLQAPQWLSPAGVRIRIVVREGGEPTLPYPRLTSRIADGGRIVIRSAASQAVGDAGRGEGVVQVTRDLLQAGEAFRTGVLDAVTLWIVTHFDRVPVHAAMVGRRGNAVVLAAPGGVGKSTLAYLAHRAGYEVPADDVVYVQLDPELRVWGAARNVRVPPAARRWFGELGQVPLTRGVDGDPKIVVPIREVSGPALTPRTRVVVCQLTGTGSRAALEPRDSAALAEVLAARLDPGFDRFRDRMPDVAQRLCARGGWCLSLSPDPHDALPYLQRMLAELEAQP